MDATKVNGPTQQRILAVVATIIGQDDTTWGLNENGIYGLLHSQIMTLWKWFASFGRHAPAKCKPYSILQLPVFLSDLLVPWRIPRFLSVDIQSSYPWNSQQQRAWVSGLVSFPHNRLAGNRLNIVVKYGQITNVPRCGCNLPMGWSNSAKWDGTVWNIAHFVGLWLLHFRKP
jgi:hypothetical protein